jgi:Acyl-CoA dehydrogenase, C-terminal domain
VLDERWGPAEVEVAEALATLLEKECPPAVVREAEAAFDGRHRRLETQLASFGLGELPTEPSLLTAVAWELGRVLAPVPFVETASVRAVLGVFDTAYGLEGPVPASVPSAVVASPHGSVRVVPVQRPGRRTSAGDLLASADHDARGADTPGGASEADRMRRMVRLLDAARLTGAAEGLLAVGVDYATRRQQFGRPIGTFQAVAHRLADVAVAVDAAVLLTRKAAWVAEPDQGGDGAPSSVFAALARARAVESARLAATSVHQVMGGYGFSLEEDCQLFSRRIRSWSMRLGPTGPELADVARTLLDPAARDQVTYLWHNDHGLPLPRWALELDGGAS